MRTMWPMTFTQVQDLWEAFGIGAGKNGEIALRKQGLPVFRTHTDVGVWGWEAGEVRLTDASGGSKLA